MYDRYEPHHTIDLHWPGHLHRDHDPEQYHVRAGFLDLHCWIGRAGGEGLPLGSKLGERTRYGE